MLKNILSGIQAYFKTFQLISKLKLWKYFGVPILISLLTATAIGFLAWGLSDNIGAFISKIWFWEWGAETFRTISDVLGALIIVAIGLILYKHIIMALSAPFMSPVPKKLNNTFQEPYILTEILQIRLNSGEAYGLTFVIYYWSYFLLFLFYYSV